MPSSISASLASTEASLASVGSSLERQGSLVDGAEAALAVIKKNPAGPPGEVKQLKLDLACAGLARDKLAVERDCLRVGLLSASAEVKTQAGEILALGNELDFANEQVDEKQASLAVAERPNAQLAAALKAAESEIERNVHLLAAAQVKLKDATEERNLAQTDCAVLSSQLQLYNAHLESTQKELDAVTISRDKYKSAAEWAQYDDNKAIHQRDEAVHQRHEAIHQRDKAIHQRDEALHQRDGAFHIINDAQMNLSGVLHCNTNLEKQNKSLQKTIEAVTDDLHKTQRNHVEARAEADTTKEELEDTRKDKLGITTELQETKQNVVALTMELEDTKRQLSAIVDTKKTVAADADAENVALAHADSDKTRDIPDIKQQNTTSAKTKWLVLNAPAPPPVPKKAPAGTWLTLTEHIIDPAVREQLEVKKKLTSTTAELSNTIAVLDATKETLADTGNSLVSTKTELATTKSELASTKVALTNTTNELATVSVHRDELAAAQQSLKCDGTPDCDRCPYHLNKSLRIFRAAEKAALQMVDDANFDRLKAWSKVHDYECQFTSTQSSEHTLFSPVDSPKQVTEEYDDTGEEHHNQHEDGDGEERQNEHEDENEDDDDDEDVSDTSSEDSVEFILGKPSPPEKSPPSEKTETADTDASKRPVAPGNFAARGLRGVGLLRRDVG